MPGPRWGHLCVTGLELESRPRDDAGLHVSQVILSLRLMYYGNPQNLRGTSHLRQVRPPGVAYSRATWWSRSPPS